MKENKKIENEKYNYVHKDDELSSLKKRIDNLASTIEKSRIREYMVLTMSKKRLFYINFIAGVGKGFGQAIGFTVLFALALYCLSKWVNLPFIGKYVAELLDIVENFREGK